MEPTHVVLLLAVLTSTTAAAPAFPVPFSGFTPYAYSNFAPPHTLPFRPLFSYAYQAEAPPAPLYSPAVVPATSFSRVIYADSTSKTPHNDMYRGFAYQTRYTDGGRSEVTFVTGPESKELMEQNMEFFRSILLPPSKAENISESETSPSVPSPNVQTKESSNKLTASALPNLQQSSVYRFQLFPAHTSPLLGNPLSLHSSINSYFQTLGHSPLTRQENTKESSDDNAEAQESMISELGRVLAPADSENDVTQSQSTSSSPEESNSIVDVPTSSNAPETTQGSTSESNSPSTEQISTDNSVTSNNEISSTQTQETSSPQTTERVATEQTSVSTEDVPVTTSEASSSSETETETTTAAQSSSSEQNENLTSTETMSEETTTQIDDTDLAESA